MKNEISASQAPARPVSDMVILALGVLGFLSLLLMAFVIVPNERSMGFVQRIFYIHVPCAWVGLLAFLVTAWHSVRHLMTRDLDHDLSAAASVEVGLVFWTLVLITGPMWAKPVWGVFWAWDLRLTSSLILWLLFVSYMVLRRSVSDPQRRATMSAVVALVSMVDLFFVIIGNQVKATQHPSPVIMGEDSGLAPIFRATLYVGAFALIFLYIALFKARRSIARVENHIEELTLAHGQP